MKYIVALVGLPGAGKSQASAFFKQKNIPVIRFGQITDEALAVKGLPKTEENEKTFRENIRQELGMAAFAVKNEPKIQAALNNADFIIVDGLRSWEEYEYLKTKFSNLLLLAIYASPQIRHNRLMERTERHLSIEEANLRDIAEILHLNMAPPIALADHLIKNETTLQEFHNELEKFLNEMNA